MAIHSYTCIHNIQVLHAVSKFSLIKLCACTCMYSPFTFSGVLLYEVGGVDLSEEGEGWRCERVGSAGGGW